MRKSPILVAAEENGGIAIGSHMPDRDGTFVALALLEAIAAKPLETLRSDLDNLCGPPGVRIRRDINLPCSDHRALHRLTRRLPVRVANRKVSERRDQDGLKLVFNDGSWLLWRPSSTEPLIRIYAEADDHHACRELSAAAIDLIMHHASPVGPV
jgi:phosphomannomutase